jgi:hypothetical protein
MSEENEKDTTIIETREKAGKRVDPILKYLDVENTEVDKNVIREKFIDIWEYENGNSLSKEEQYMTLIASFIYTAHNVMDEANIRIDKARDSITSALSKWTEPNRAKLIEKEKASENPFKTFVENHQPQVDDSYPWRHFLLEHKKADEKQWVYKMKKCWYAEFFIRFGRVDYIQTACAFDKIPWENRKEYVDLKLSNLFANLGTLCQFDYKPKKE